MPDARASVHLCTLVHVGEIVLISFILCPVYLHSFKGYYLMYFAYTYVYAMFRAQQRVSDHQELELLMAGSHHMDDVT